MKVTVGEKTKVTKPFPKYMRTEYGLEVLMTEYGRGIVTKGARHHLLGDGSNAWGMHTFKDVEEAEESQTEKPFPKYMQNKYGLVVFMTAKGCGIVTKKQKNHPSREIGYQRDDWNMDAFKDVEETEETDTVTKSTKPFPKLMENINTGAVYLMRSPIEGTCMKKTKKYEFLVGEMYHFLPPSEFRDFNLPVTLQND